MAKKKRKKRPVQRPSQGTGTATAARPEAPDRSPSARAERKEQARRERERRIKLARRRQRIRRATRWGIAAVVVAGIGGFIWMQARQSGELSARATAAAGRIGCGKVQTPSDEGAQHLQPTDAPPTYGTTPAASGPHSGSSLPPDPAVYEQPIPEVNAVHNLEHGYVLLYYRADGPGALPESTVSELQDLAESESEVIMAPYPNLPEGTSLSLVAWTRLLDCGGQGAADDARLVAENFIQQFKNATAPEAEVP
jgi:hypothetical protein